MTVEEFERTRPPGTRCRDFFNSNCTYRILEYFSYGYGDDEVRLLRAEAIFGDRRELVQGEWTLSACLRDPIVQDFETALKDIVEISNGNPE